jgi:hypothetical protein
MINGQGLGRTGLGRTGLGHPFGAQNDPLKIRLI